MLQGKRAFIFVLCAMSLFLSACGQMAEKKGDRVVTDAMGTAVTIGKSETKPHRIMSYSMAIDETLLGLVETERMISVDAMLVDDSQSNVARVAEKVANHTPRMPSVEKVAGFQPDLIFAQPHIPPDQIDALRGLGIPVVICRRVSNLEDVIWNIRLVSAAVGEEERGEKLIAKMQKSFLELEEKLQQVPQAQQGKSVAFVSIMASYGGKGCSFDAMCEKAHAINAKAAYGNMSGTAMTKEDFVACNPDYIFLPSYQKPQSNEEKYGAEYISDPSLQTMQAIRENHICRPWARYVYNGSQNIVFGAWETARMLYGEDFAQGTQGHLSALSDEAEGAGSE